MRALFGRDADAVVAHRQASSPVLEYADLDFDPALGGTELDRVVEQVHQHLTHAQAVDERAHRPRRIQHDLLVARGDLRELGEFLGECCQVAGQPLELELASFDTRGVQQPRDQPLEPFHLRLDLLYSR